MKKTFYNELAYLLGIILLAIGTAFMERADFGMSVIVAPAYLLHLKISKFLPFFTFGMAEYVLQAFLILLLVIVLKKFRLAYLFSFVTAVLYGFLLDGAIFLISLISYNSLALKIIFYAVGLLLCTASISLLFHTYISPEAYELVVKEISSTYKLNINKVKITYDVISCIVSIILSFAFFGLWQFKGIGWGSIISTFINGLLIAMFTKLFERFFEFCDGLPLRKYFENKKRENQNDE